MHVKVTLIRWWKLVKRKRYQKTASFKAHIKKSPFSLLECVPFTGIPQIISTVRGIWVKQRQ
uniref:Uncharacterized protein n=1 Tax=Anguilla anguilla TaxID=7936 RepID=A0A0E9PY72_ANGAN